MLVIGAAALNTPVSYFVSIEQANGQFTHISFATFAGSVGLSFIDITPDQASPNQTDTPFSSGVTSVGQLNDVTVNENTRLSIGTFKAFVGNNLRFTVSGLPSGLSINDSNTGTITGTTPNVVDVDNISALITVTATDSSGTTTTLSFTLTIINSDRSDDTPAPVVFDD